MIKGLAVTTPILGTIRLGDVAVNEKGTRYPVRCNHFKITGQFKNENGQWVEHPMHAKVAKAMGVEPDKITEIPIRLMYNDPDLTMRARYEAFDRKGRIVCAGDGECARRSTGEKVESVPCPGAEHCAFGQQAKCDLFARLNVQIEGQEDELSSFILRTESFNSVKTLTAKLTAMHALFGGRLTGIPFKLKLRQKASSQSHWSRFFYVDLILNGVSLAEAASMAKAWETTQLELGLIQSSYEKAVKDCIGNGAFEEGAAEFDEIEPFLLARNDEFGDIPEGDAPMVDSTPQMENGLPTGLAGLRDMLAAAEAGEVGATPVIPNGEDMFADEKA